MIFSSVAQASGEVAHNYIRGLLSAKAERLLPGWR